VLSGQTLTVPTLTLPVTRSSIGGTVTLAGTSDHSGASVIATAAWNPALTHSGSTNTAGTYTISGVEPGMWTVVASKTNYGTVVRENVFVQASSPTVGVNFSLPYQPSGVPTSLVYVSGGSNDSDPNQSGVVYTALAAPFVVEVRDGQGDPVAGTQVYFQVVTPQTDGHMQNVAAFILTDANGRASDTYILGKVVGQNHVRAGATSVPGQFVNFYATGTPGVPAEVLATGGSGQTGVVGQALSTGLSLAVQDAWDNATPGVTCSFAPSGNGSANPTSAVTGLTGLTGTAWTLGTTMGEQTLTVTCDSASHVFHATADHGAASALVKVGGDNQTGINTMTLSTALEVEVRDTYGNPVDGVTVSFAVTTGSGTLNPSVPQTTNVLGRASTSLTLSSLGSLGVTASTAGLSSVVFAATSLAGNPSRLVLVSGGGQEATVGTQLASPLVVRVEDNYNNPVASATAHFVPKATSGTVGLMGATNIVTNAQGQAQTTFTLGALAGATVQWVEVTVNDFPSVAMLSIPVSAEPDEPANIEIVSGNNQLAAYGQQLTEPLVVYLEDQYGNPVWDELVSWSSTTGGTVGPNPAITESNGQGTVTAILGSTPSMPDQDFTAEANGLGVTFHATATGHWIEWIEPGRTWPECPVDLEVEILGGGFDADAMLIWNAGGAEQSLVPSTVESDRIVVTFTDDLFDLPGEYPLTVQQTVGGRCATYDFVVGSVLPDTGQRLCYNNTGQMTCPAEGQDFWGQDAQFGWDLHITPAERFERTEPVANQPVVFDRLTQLEWQGCAAGLSGADCATGSASTMNWYWASGTADPTYNPGGVTDTCGNLDWGGHTDWRLPTVKELSGIVDAGRSSPYIDGTAFPATPSYRFWSSSSHVTYSGHAWAVYFGDGRVSYYAKNDTGHARCVRGRVGPSDTGPFESLVLSGDRVVRDTSTGLAWQGCVAGRSGDSCDVGFAAFLEWKEALAYCAELDWGGYGDWRLPDRGELQSIVDYNRYSPSIDPTAFPQTPSSYFWSSSSLAASSNLAWYMVFNSGNVDNFFKNSTAPARCVRGRVGP
jgi:hypothetical protein